VIRNDQEREREREELLEYAEILAKDTQSSSSSTTTTVNSQAKGETVKNMTESEKQI